MKEHRNHNTKNIDSETLADELSKARAYFYTNYRRSMEHAQNALPLAKRLGDVPVELRLYAIIGYNLARAGEFRRAFHFFNKGLEIEPLVNDLLLKSILFVNIGDTYRLQNKYEPALENYYKALQYEIPAHIGVIYNNIGFIHTQQGKYGKALKYLNLSLKGKSEQGGHLADTYNNLGLLHIRTGDLDRAQECLSKGLEVAREDHMREAEIMLLESSGIVHQLQGQMGTALFLFTQAKDLAQEVGFIHKVISHYLKIGEVYEGMDGQGLAITAYKTGMGLSVKLGITADGFKCMEQLHALYQAAGNYKEAYRFSYAMLEAMKEQTLSGKREEVYRIIEGKEQQIDLLTDNNEKIARQNEELERQNRELRQYAYIIAHDLREPLRNISGFSSLLARRLEGQLSGDTSEYLRFIKSGVDRMDALMKDLLAYATLDEASKSQFDVHHIGEIIQDALTLAAIPDIQVEAELEDFPKIHCHYKQVRQVFSQLIGNAYQYRKPDTPCWVHISVVEREHFYEFRLRDNGVGIPPENLDSIFLLFRQLNRNGGTGMGLPISKKVVELHGGRIWAESDGESGTTFAFTLPCRMPSPPKR